MLIPSEQDFAQAVALWREWNGRINVISRKDEDNIFAHHILHSLAIAQYLELFHSVIPSEAKESILDVGCGGGFPGIPLAMVMPEAKFTLCDSIGKKVKVAQAVADGLGLKNVECVNARAESLAGEWDWVVSRAVTSLENFYPWVKGRFRNSILYLKGGDIDAEIAALQKKYHVPAANIRTWRIDSWLKDEYFAEKFVIEIGKNYLCTP
ncbi:MAG: 16S rRNA (guanine(527)-N(7))-methyltransferase RsmG [Bacteroidales bacterium]|nr:16S rRNA (guanine(527)-N(7))-methyltransferase RsmG [Bacteroidales bacterium]